MLMTTGTRIRIEIGEQSADLPKVPSVNTER